MTYPLILSSYKDKVAVVLGGSSGIGEAIAKAYYEQGAKVYVIGLTPLEKGLVRGTKEADDYIAKQVEASQAACPARGGAYPLHTPQYYECDVTAPGKEDPDSLHLLELLQMIGERHGHIDCIADSVGYSPRKKIRELTMRDLTTVYGANAAYIPVVFPKIESYLTATETKPAASIVFLGSTLPHGITDSDSMSYGGAKAARAIMANGLSVELGKKGINVTVVSPSHVPTKNETEIMGVEKAQATAEAAKKKRRNGAALLAQDVARVVLCYTSPEMSRFSTGETIFPGDEVLLGSTKRSQLSAHNYKTDAATEVTRRKQATAEQQTDVLNELLGLVKSMKAEITSLTARVDQLTQTQEPQPMPPANRNSQRGVVLSIQGGKSSPAPGPGTGGSGPHSAA